MLVWSVASSLAAAVLATEAARVLGAESAPGPSVVAVPMVAAATAAEAAETEFKAVLGLCGYRLADAAWMATTCSEKRLAADLLAGKAEAEATAAQGRGARSALRVFADTVAEVEAGGDGMQIGCAIRTSGEAVSACWRKSSRSRGSL